MAFKPEHITAPYQPKNRILRRPEVEALTGCSRSTLYARIAAGEFPKPVKLGGPNSRSVGWPESVVMDWIEARMADSGYDTDNAA
jgi:prophage regulatory protein